METYDIKSHYEGYVRSAANWQLVALINREVDCDKPVADVLQDLALDEAMRRGHLLPVLWAMSLA